jgi:chemotaxis protein methyltransferase CheR
VLALTGIQGLRDGEFNFIKEIVHKESGIRLTELKRALVQSRLMKRLRELKLWNYEEYCTYLEHNYDLEVINLINCITTNKTDFFREERHFEFMREVFLPEFERGGKKKLRIWSAGCSNGAEPYSIAITVREYFSGRGGRIRLQRNREPRRRYAEKIFPEGHWRI